MMSRFVFKWLSCHCKQTHTQAETYGQASLKWPFGFICRRKAFSDSPWNMDQIAIAVTDTHTGGGGESSCGTAYLPEECIASILSFTTPRDACRSSLVSTMFKSAADSDAVWERFLPPEYKTLMSLLPPADSFSCSSMKELYLGLSGYGPILIENGRKVNFSISFSDCVFFGWILNWFCWWLSLLLMTGANRAFYWRDQAGKCVICYLQETSR